MLFRAFFEAKLVNIDISARFLGGVAEEAELGSHEEATPVETEPIVLCSNLRPLLAIEAIEEVGAICTTHTTASALPWTEIGIDAEVYFRGARSEE